MNIFTFKDKKIIHCSVAQFKNKLILLFSFCSMFFIAQNKLNTNNQSDHANTVQNPKSKNVASANTQSVYLSSIRHDTCLNKKFSIVVYVFENYSMTIASSSLNVINNTYIPQKINYLNNLFKRICVSFEHCRTVVIPNWEYEKWKNATVDDVVYANFSTENTINLYLVSTTNYSKCQLDYSYKPDEPSSANPKNMVVSILDAPPGADLAHAFGHFFGLDHTHAEINGTPASPPPPIQSSGLAINSNEFVDGSNCALYGDGLCDTEADPYPANTSYNRNHVMCDYNGGVKDGKGDFYTPPLDNFMSFYTCRCRFTQQQYNKMAETIITKRMYLH